MHRTAVMGSIGENLATTDMHDKNVNIGDIYRVGDVTVQVTSPRIPCWKIEEKLNQKGLVELIKNQQITGWYYRVLENGTITLGDSITLVERPNANLSVASFVQQHFDKNTSADPLHQMSNAIGLDSEWQQKLLRRIDSQ